MLARVRVPARRLATQERSPLVSGLRAKYDRYSRVIGSTVGADHGRASRPSTIAAGVWLLKSRTATAFDTWVGVAGVPTRSMYCRFTNDGRFTKGGVIAGVG